MENGGHDLDLALLRSQLNDKMLLKLSEASTNMSVDLQLMEW